LKNRSYDKKEDKIKNQPKREQKVDKYKSSIVAMMTPIVATMRTDLVPKKRSKSAKN
jgi:hypothetical protein